MVNHVTSRTHTNWTEVSGLCGLTFSHIKVDIQLHVAPEPLTHSFAIYNHANIDRVAIQYIIYRYKMMVQSFLVLQKSSVKPNHREHMILAFYNTLLVAGSLSHLAGISIIYRRGGCKLSSAIKGDKVTKTICILFYMHMALQVYLGLIFIGCRALHRPLMALISCAHHKDQWQLLSWGSKVFMAPRCISPVIPPPKHKYHHP